MNVAPHVGQKNGYGVAFSKHAEIFGMNPGPNFASRSTFTRPINPTNRTFKISADAFLDSQDTGALSMSDA